jgi:hypothetical protein
VSQMEGSLYAQCAHMGVSIWRRQGAQKDRVYLTGRLDLRAGDFYGCEEPHAWTALRAMSAKPLARASETLVAGPPLVQIAAGNFGRRWQRQAAQESGRQSESEPDTDTEVWVSGSAIPRS